MNSFIGEKEESPSGKYNLRSVVHHIGRTAFSGHYTACAKRTLKKQQQQGEADANAATNAAKTTNQNNNDSAQKDNGEQWVFFDDRVGTKKSMDYVTGSETNQRNCYMALYELKK